MSQRARGMLLGAICLFLCINLSVTSPSDFKTAAETCSTNEECQFLIEGSTCDGNVCICAKDTTLSSDGTSCLTVAHGSGSACEDTVQCSAGLNAGGICLNKVCTCKDGYHYLKGQCWKSVNLGGSCTRTENCYAAFDFIGLECVSGVCKCRDQYYERGGGCRRKRVTGEDCAADTDCQCSGTVGKCTSRVCVCSGSASKADEVTISHSSKIRQTFENPDSCDPGTFPCTSGACSGTCALELGTACSSAEDKCAEGVGYAVCFDDLLCGCESSLRARDLSNRVCNKVAQAINGPCVDSGQCSIFGGLAKCDKNVCACSAESHYDAKTLLCRSSSYVGDHCDADEDCVTISGGNVACLSGVCTCLPGSHQANGKLDCRVDATHVGDKCTEDADCSLYNSVCDPTKKVCGCTPHFFADKSGLCVNGIGSDCENSADCSHIAESICDIAVCNCTEGFVSSGDFQSCLKVNEYNGTCLETNQCDPQMGDLKVCNNGKCLCQEGSQYLLGKCYKMKELGDKCSARAECIPSLGIIEAYMCQNGICACQYGYHREDNMCMP